jgi:hypothetical protein
VRAAGRFGRRRGSARLIEQLSLARIFPESRLLIGWLFTLRTRLETELFAEVSVYYA